MTAIAANSLIIGPKMGRRGSFWVRVGRIVILTHDIALQYVRLPEHYALVTNDYDCHAERFSIDGTVMGAVRVTYGRGWPFRLLALSRLEAGLYAGACRDWLHRKGLLK